MISISDLVSMSNSADVSHRRMRLSVSLDSLNDQISERLNAKRREFDERQPEQNAQRFERAVHFGFGSNGQCELGAGAADGVG